MDKFNFAYATDLLIFSVDSRTTNNVRELPKKYFSVLLVKREKEPFINNWCLPGGFVLDNENSKDAVKRVLKKETNLEKVYTEQLCIFDDVDRDPRGRVISATYMALIDKSKLKEQLNKNAKLFDIEIEEKDNIIDINLFSDIEKEYIKLKKELIDKTTNEYKYTLLEKSNIAFDHDKIINYGINNLRKKVNDTDIIFNLMPEEFTIGELKQVYELILGKKLINSAFRRTINSKVIPTKEIVKTGGHRPSVLYKYKSK